MKTNLIDNNSFIDYKKYLQSPRWKKLRERAKKRDEYCCKVCNSITNLQVHHRNYYRLKKDGEIKDLITLCERCHKMFHLYNKPFATNWEQSYNSKFDCLHLPHSELKTFIQQEIDKIIYDFSN